MPKHQLARTTELSADMLAVVQARAGTNQKVMEMKRREFGATALALEAQIAELMDEKNKLDPTSPEYHQKFNTANLLGLAATVQGLSFIADCLSHQAVKKIKGTGEKAYARVPLSAFSFDFNTMLFMMQEQQETLLEMVNDMGCAQKAFKDKNGVHSDTKYFDPEDAEKPTGSDEVDESDALGEHAAQEIEKKSPAQVLKDMGKKK